MSIEFSFMIWLLTVVIGTCVRCELKPWVGLRSTFDAYLLIFAWFFYLLMSWIDWYSGLWLWGTLLCKLSFKCKLYWLWFPMSYWPPPSPLGPTLNLLPVYYILPILFPRSIVMFTMDVACVFPNDRPWISLGKSCEFEKLDPMRFPLASKRPDC
jgi:hypothetical protein